MSNETRFDAHCHIFNLQYALKEAANLLWDHGRGMYHDEDTKALTVSKKDDRKNKIRNLIQWFKQLVTAAFDSEEENLDYLLSTAKNEWNTASVSTYPLMMDIFYLFYPPVLEGVSVQKSLKLLQEFDYSHEDYLDDIREIFDEVKTLKYDRLPSKGIKTNFDHSTIIDKIFEDIRDEILNRKKAKSPYNFSQTWGFRDEMNDLIDLVKKRPEDLYPFFAVDPRREGVIEAVLNGDLVSKTGPFYGVKLYPRLGYHPNCVDLNPLYHFCSKNDIPITTHCSPGGFPTEDWQYKDLGNPENFRNVLQKYPTLRIDFAHFGNPDDTWRKTIVDLMQYPNVYTDLSCYTSTDSLNTIKENYWSSELFRSRCMYGTDYDIMYVTKPITLQTYFENFQNTFTEDELVTMSQTIPSMFMNREITVAVG
jgi:predicted TIM-barrel fold metal-dependent hydrolase